MYMCIYIYIYICTDVCIGRIDLGEHGAVPPGMPVAVCMDPAEPGIVGKE